MHMPDLRFLTRALNADAIEGPEALEALMGLRTEHHEAVQARRQAQQEAQGSALDGLLGTTLEAAGEPQTPQDAMRVAQATAMFGQGQPAAGTAALFLPEGSRYEGNWGQSRIDPTLRPEDAFDIAQMAKEGASPEVILQEFASIYGPNTLERLQQEIYAIISENAPSY